MKSTLTFFDKLMLAVTFAEAGMEAPEYQTTAKQGQKAHTQSGKKNSAAREHKILVANG
jgi:hypothetical protein